MNCKRLSSRLRPFLVGALALALLATTAAPTLADSGPPPFKADAKAALLIDFASGDVLYSQNPDQVFSPASITKLMTLRLAYQAIHAGKIKLEDKVPIGKDAWAQNPAFKDASLMYIKPGDDVTVLQIMQGIAIPSGNDASVALADFLGGTVDAFVAQMNEEAKKLGMTHTHFVDPDGLSPDDQSTAADLALLARAYIQEEPEALTQLHSVQHFTFAGITQDNYNLLLGYYQGADGLKTGFLDNVGYNQISTAKRGDMRLISVVLGTASKEARRDQSAAVLDYGFNNFTSIAVVKKDAAQGSVQIWKGKADSVAAVPAQDVVMALPKGAESRLKQEKQLSESWTAPIAAGQKLGTLTFTLDGKVVQTVDLVAQNDVAKGGIFKRMWDSIKLFFRGLFHKKK